MDELSVQTLQSELPIQLPTASELSALNSKTKKPEKKLHYFARQNREKYGITPESYTEMDLNALLIENKVASYLYAAGVDNLELIQKDSVLLVDGSIKQQVGNIVVAEVNGDIVLRRFVKMYDPSKKQRLAALVTDDESEPPIFLHDDYTEAVFRGVVLAIINFAC
jgi:hypothetical protein